MALGLGLKRRQTIKIVTHSIFQSWIESYRLEFAAVEGAPIGFLEPEEGNKIAVQTINKYLNAD